MPFRAEPQDGSLTACRSLRMYGSSTVRSEIETAARDCIGTDVEVIASAYGFDAGIEDADQQAPAAGEAAQGNTCNVALKRGAWPAMGTGLYIRQLVPEAANSRPRP